MVADLVSDKTDLMEFGLNECQFTVYVFRMTDTNCTVASRTTIYM